MIVPLEKPGTPTELIHYGVKGMKWGVRNRRIAAGAAGIATTVAVGAAVPAPPIATIALGAATTLVLLQKYGNVKVINR